MELELFTVYLKENGETIIKINEDVVDAYGMTVEEFQNKIKTENLYQGIKDFCEPFN